MTLNYTHLEFTISENKSAYDDLNYDDTMQETLKPSDAVIRNLLNYSRALTTVFDMHTGNTHTILLN